MKNKLWDRKRNGKATRNSTWTRKQWCHVCVETTTFRMSESGNQETHTCTNCGQTQTYTVR